MSLSNSITFSLILESLLSANDLTDRQNLDRLIAIDTPASIDFVELARLLIRYQDFKGADDLNADMEKLLKKWSLNRDKLEEITRKIWSDGFRPSSHSSLSLIHI